MANSSLPRYATAAPRARSGRRCQASAGQTGSPRPRRWRWIRAAVCWPSCRISATSMCCTRPPSCSSTTREWRRCPQALVPPSATAAGFRCSVATHAWSSAPAAPFSRPIADLGLVMVWDDGDDTLAEPRAPYPHAREVAMLRAHQLRCAALIGGYPRTAEAHALVRSRWAHDLVAPRPVVRAHAPRVVALEDSGYAQERDPAARTARLPSVALRAARTALEAGRPVLVQVPRRGYVPALACARCRTIARCRHCTGPLSLPERDAAGAVCRWCARVEPALRCARCGSDAVRAVVVGARRTAEELGRAFPGTAVITSGGEAMVTDVPGEPAVVVATPGAEPVAAGGYGAALLLDGWALLGRQDLRASEDALAALDGRHRAGSQPRRRRDRRRRRRIVHPHRAGADPLGPGRPRRGRARRALRGGPAARGAHRSRRRRACGSERAARNTRNCQTMRTSSALSSCLRVPGDRRESRRAAR